ncbi:MAG: hypothetical protein C0608_04580 [Deltaproteobacteria bacterium]|nr:MAG: hypothetical protein C0608_04580 [Deltaproteobacteria bacterium]
MAKDKESNRFDGGTAKESAALSYLSLRISMERFGRPPEDLIEEELAQVSKAAKDELMLHNLILASKEAEQVTVYEATVEEAFEASVSSFGDLEAFRDELRSRGLDEELYKYALSRELKVHAILDWVGNRAKEVTEEELTTLYEENREKLKTPETRLARHILITVNPEYAENTEERAEGRIKKLRREIMKKPERFGELAKIHSECPSSIKEGLIGPVPEGRLFPILNKLLFSMESGETSPIARTEMGYHLIRCEEINPANNPTLAEAAPKLKESIYKQRAGREKKEFIAKLLAAKVKEQGKEKGAAEDESIQ